MRLLAVTLVSFIVFAGVVSAQEPQPKRISIGKVVLTYVENGKGEPLIFLHGGQADYRSWIPYFSRFSGRFRTITYSRRYNFPNDNPIDIRNHSAYVEAKDLASFIKILHLKRVHLVGTSIGAYTALIYAVKHPENVASLTLAEPAINAWVKDTPEYSDFLKRAWLPASEAFRKGDDRSAMRLIVDVFGGAGAFDKLPAEAQAVAMANARFFRAATLSTDPTPDISKTKVRRLKMPILIIEGENTFMMSKLIVKELEALLPRATKVLIPHAGHGSFRENPKAFGDAVERFLATSSQK